MFYKHPLCSPWGNRTPLARMKILSTNRYTNGPSFYVLEGLPLNCDAKVVQIFELCNSLWKFFQKKRVSYQNLHKELQIKTPKRFG